MVICGNLNDIHLTFFYREKHLVKSSNCSPSLLNINKQQSHKRKRGRPPQQCSHDSCSYSNKSSRSSDECETSFESNFSTDSSSPHSPPFTSQLSPIEHINSIQDQSEDHTCEEDQYGDNLQVEAVNDTEEDQEEEQEMYYENDDLCWAIHLSPIQSMQSQEDNINTVTAVSTASSPSLNKRTRLYNEEFDSGMITHVFFDLLRLH